MPTASATAVESRWQAIVARLQERRHDMTDEFVARLGDIDGYEEEAGLVAAQDKHDVALEALRLILQSLAVGSTDAALLRFGTHLGETRARQGVSAESVTTAVRMTFSVIWSRVLEICGPEDSTLLVGRVALLWRVIDDYANQSHTSYVDERVRMEREESELRQGAVSALLTGRVTTPEAVKRTAAVLDVQSDVRFELLAGTGPELRATLLALVRTLKVTTRVFTHLEGDTTFVLWSRRPDPPDPLPAGCGHVGDIDGLGGVRVAALLAGALAELATEADTGPLTVGSHWPRLARAALTERGVDLAAQLDGQLAECADAERERLVTTVLTFLRSGSIAATAGELFCHRNTILNRINRFRELTGLDLTVPVDAARAYVAWT